MADENPLFKDENRRLEWIDPITGKKYTCPKGYERVVDHLGFGEKSRKLGAHILLRMGKSTCDTNERHLRKAVSLHRRIGVPIVALMSKKGGYYIAITQPELETFLEFMYKHARSILRNIDRMREDFNRRLESGAA